MAKLHSVEAKREWERHGRPRQGPVFLEFSANRRLYKRLIRQKKKAHSQAQWATLSLGALSSVCARKKIGRLTGRAQKPSAPHHVEGLTDPKLVADRFADQFAEISTLKDHVRA